MEKVIQTKIARFIELSGKFSKSVDDVFRNENSNGHYMPVNSGSFLTLSSLSNYNNVMLDGRELYIENGVVKAKDKKIITRGDMIRAEAEAKAKLSDEFDEYNILRNDLSEYFKVLNKITE